MRRYISMGEKKERRLDQKAGHAGAYKKNRERILKTQTVCGICGRVVDFELKYPHPLSATVDHIVPVSRGGHPSDLNNLQLAHWTCNRQKYDKLTVSEKKAERTEVISNRVLPLHCDWKSLRI